METIKISCKQDRATQNCDSCGVSHCTETNNMICGGCHWVGYCSRTCQERDWENHKRFCRSFSSQKSCLHNTKGKTDHGDMIIGIVITIKVLGEAEIDRDSNLSDVIRKEVVKKDVKYKMLTERVKSPPLMKLKDSAGEAEYIVHTPTLIYKGKPPGESVQELLWVTSDLFHIIKGKVGCQLHQIFVRCQLHQLMSIYLTSSISCWLHGCNQTCSGVF